VTEGSEIQTKGIRKLFNELTVEIFPNLGKDMDIQIQDAYRTPNRLDQKRNCTYSKISGPENKERILKSTQEKH
jgi:hypothetical protein